MIGHAACRVCGYDLAGRWAKKCVRLKMWPATERSTIQ